MEESDNGECGSGQHCSRPPYIDYAPPPPTIRTTGSNESETERQVRLTT